MKKLILGALATILTAVGFATVSADAVPFMPPQTDVTGVITKNHSTVAVAGATVTGDCNGHMMSDTTDAHGSYLLVYPTTMCAFGDTIHVTATDGSLSGANSGTIQGITTKLNLAVVNVDIPEYGLIGAIAAGSAGIGLVAFTRRRQYQAQL
jgi:hypothetical protein